MRIIIFLLVFFNISFAVIVDTTRRVVWDGNVGVSGDIPTDYTKYGSTLSPTGGDDTAMIEDSLNNAANGQYVELASDTFLINGTIDIPDSVILRGQGIDSTILLQQSSTSGATISFNTSSWSSTDYNLASGYTKGSTSITTSSAHGW